MVKSEFFIYLFFYENVACFRANVNYMNFSKNIDSRATPVLSDRGGLRGDGVVHRSLSRERSLTRVGIRARSGSRERIEDRGRRSEERVRRADSSGSRNCITRPSPSPTGN